jgi:hypothetical protein
VALPHDASPEDFAPAGEKDIEILLSGSQHPYNYPLRTRFMTMYHLQMLKGAQLYSSKARPLPSPPRLPAAASNARAQRTALLLLLFFFFFFSDTRTWVAGAELQRSQRQFPRRLPRALQ